MEELYKQELEKLESYNKMYDGVNAMFDKLNQKNDEDII